MHTPVQRLGSALLQRQASSDRRAWFRLVTRDVDRHGTIIEPGGVDTTAFERNPVFLWMHDSGGSSKSTPPPDVVIGRVVGFDRSPDFFDIEVEFDDDGPDGLASTCLRKVRDGFLRMVSIGCNVVEESAVRVGDVMVPVYTRTELLECSLVIVGSNRSAVKLDRAAVTKMLREVADTAMSPAVSPAKQVATVAVYAQRENSMLWGRRRDDNKWTTPGGHVHEGEKPKRAAVRELYEESGIKARKKDLDYLGAVVNDKGVVIHTYRLDLPAEATPDLTRDPDKEIAHWKWIPLRDGRLPDEVLQNLHAPKNTIVAALRLDRAVAGAGGPAVDALLSSEVVNGVDVSGIGSFGFDEDDDLDYELLPDGAADGGGMLVVASAKPPLTATRGVVAHAKYPIVDGAWDADAAVARWRKWASKDGSGDKEQMDWGKYAACFLWFDDKDPENSGSYKFPHHDIRDGKPVTVKQALFAAASRLGSAKGIPTADIVKMKAHLASHYKEADMVAPWQRVEHDIPGGFVAAWANVQAGRASCVVRGGVYIPSAMPLPVVTTTPPDAPKPTATPVPSVMPGPAIVDQDDVPYAMAATTLHALLFPCDKFTVEAAKTWAQKHGYAPVCVEDEGDYMEFVQLSADLFKRNGLGPDCKFFNAPIADDVIGVFGVLKGKGDRGLLSAVARNGRVVSKPALYARYSPRKPDRVGKASERLWRQLVDTTMSSSVRAEIGYGLSRSVTATPVAGATAPVAAPTAWTLKQCLSASRGRRGDLTRHLLNGGDVGVVEAKKLIQLALQRLWRCRFIAQ